jgi:hypothetical protein
MDTNHNTKYKIPSLTIEAVIQHAHSFALMESKHRERSLFGVTDGKAVGTYLEHKCHDYLAERYDA